MRGKNQHDGVPPKIYFLKLTYGPYCGPYVKKPTALMNERGGKILTFVYSKLSGNYEFTVSSETKMSHIK